MKQSSASSHFIETPRIENTVISQLEDFLDSTHIVKAQVTNGLPPESDGETDSDAEENSVEVIR